MSKDNPVRKSKNYFSLPYNPILKQRARKLRNTGNLAEVLLWSQLRNKQFKSFDFDRQKIIGNYIVDFYCVNKNVVLEVDGSSHIGKKEYDAKRDIYLQSLGLKIIHIPNEEILDNLDGVMQYLKKHDAFK